MHETKDTAGRELRAGNNSACWEEAGYTQRDIPVQMKLEVAKMIAGPWPLTGDGKAATSVLASRSL